MPENAVRAVLEAYTVIGVIGLARRDGNHRSYDLIERLLPADLLAHEVPAQEQLRHKLLSRYRAHGLLGAGGAGAPSPASPTAGPAGSCTTAGRARLPAARRCRGCARQALRRPPTRSRCSKRRPSRRHRSRSSRRSTRCCGTPHSWRTCSPSSTSGRASSQPAKRRWGYYVLPITFGDRFVGRIEPRIDRERAAWTSASGGRTGSRRDVPEGFVDPMRAALRAYLRFAGDDRVSGRATSRRRSGSSAPARELASRAMTRQVERVAAFRRLHEAGCFVMPNPWDVGSAVALEGMGFVALATTSAGFAWTLGPSRQSSTARRDAGALRQIAGAVKVPVNADFEGGFADDPQEVGVNVKLAAATGVAGFSIEDSTGSADEPLYPFDLAVERVRRRGGQSTESGTGVVLTGRRRDSSSASPTSTRRSSGSRPTRTRAPTASTRRGSRRQNRSRRSWPPCLRSR